MSNPLKSMFRRMFPPPPRTRPAEDPEARKRSVETLEGLFFDICEELSPDLFIEAGAKDAYASRRLRRRLPNARIMAFEANPFTFKRFDRKVDFQKEGIEYRHRALSDSEGTVTFNVRVVDGKMSADGQGSMLVSKRSEVPTEAFEVPSSRIDDLCPPDSFGRCAIWMDVEGASQQVLTGATSILHKVDAMFVEVEDREAWAGQWLVKDVRAFLLGHDLIAVGRDFQSSHQNNVLFVNRSALENERVRSLAATLPPRARL